MKLTDLDPHFLTDATPESWREDDDVTLAEADGVRFLCPKCFAANGGPVGTHSIVCWRPRVPQTIKPTPGRWEMEGTGYADLSLVAGSSSVLLTGPGCQAHFFVRGGEIVGC